MEMQNACVRLTLNDVDEQTPEGCNVTPATAVVNLISSGRETLISVRGWPGCKEWLVPQLREIHCVLRWPRDSCARVALRATHPGRDAAAAIVTGIQRSCVLPLLIVSKPFCRCTSRTSCTILLVTMATAV
jgi:hypothetical protein